MANSAPNYKPDNMHDLTAHLFFNGNCREAITFYEKAFSAKLLGGIALSPDGKTVWHAMVKIGDSNLMLADTMPGLWEKGPDGFTTASLWIYTDDCDALFTRALEAGCEQTWDMMDAFWGDRMGKCKDPFGHTWAIATHKENLTPEEIQQRQEAWLASMKPEQT